MAEDFVHFLLATDALLEADDPHSSPESDAFIAEMLSSEVRENPEREIISEEFSALIF